MSQHTCSVEDSIIAGQRANPLDASWSEWTLVACSKCKKLYEWQHHSEERMHGGDLEVTALVSPDYLLCMYQLTPADVDLILAGKRKVRCYNRYKNSIEEREA